MWIFIVWLIFCFVSGAVGNNRKVGFWGAFLWSLFLSPIIGLIIALASDRREVGPKISPVMTKLVFEGDNLFKASNYDGAIEKYLSALKYSDKAPQTNFKLAKLYSIKKDGQSSLRYLEFAIQSGFKEFDKIHKDPDLAYLRDLHDFKTYVANNYKKPVSDTETNVSLSKADELEKLTRLLEKGVLTKEEFDNEKKKLLSL